MQSVAGQLDGLMERLSQLQRSADQNRLRATDTRQTAEKAGEQARSTQQVPGSGTLLARTVTATLCFPAVDGQQSRLCPGMVLGKARRLSCSSRGSCVVASLLVLMQFPTR